MLRATLKPRPRVSLPREKSWIVNGGAIAGGAPFIFEDDEPRRTQRRPFHDALATEIHGPIVEEVTAASALPIIVEIAIDRSMLAPSSRRLISTLPLELHTSAATSTGIMPHHLNVPTPVTLFPYPSRLGSLASTISFHLDDNPTIRETSWTGSYEGSWLMIIWWRFVYSIPDWEEEEKKKIFRRKFLIHG